MNKEMCQAKLLDGLKQLSITISDTQAAQMLHYMEMVQKKNEVMNLTAITEDDEFIIKHLVDSSALFGFCDLKGKSVIDVGTGAGFPGIPLKIVCPSISLCLLDSLDKRIHFLDEVVEKLELASVQTVHARAEDGAASKRNPRLREQFDVAVSRAVANFSTLSEYTLPYVKVGGFFAAYKSGTVDEELGQAKHALSILGGEVETVFRFCLPVVNEARTIVIVRKVKETSGVYPRKAGTPVRKPL